MWGAGSVSEDADSQKPRPVVKTERGGMGATLLIEGERELARRFEALSSSKGDEWAWVELNYRPHAYQTAAECGPAMTSADPPWYRSLPR